MFCQVGLRGYVAARLLSQRGFRVRNLSGGYKRYRMCKDATDAPPGPSPELRDEDGRSTAVAGDALRAQPVR